MKKKAIIISIKSFKLNSSEKKLLQNQKPWGIILFKRNIKSSYQLKKLIKDIRSSSKDKKFPILIDEEGKTVSRLGDIIHHNFTQKFFGDLYKKDSKTAILFFKQYIDNL